MEYLCGFTIHKKAEKLQYFRGDSFFTGKDYQRSENKKKNKEEEAIFIH